MSTKAIRYVLAEMRPNHRVTEDDVSAAVAEVDAIERDLVETREVRDAAVKELVRLRAELRKQAP